MSEAGLKTEIKTLIENESDVEVLEAIYTLLQKTSLDPELKIRLTARALRSEEDLREGRIYDREEVIRRTQR
jgi:hypothetical protein